jgi:RNA polymerase sigma-B factor
MTARRPIDRSGVRGGNEPRVEADRVLFERLADRRDPVDRDLLVERFLPLARSVASRYLRRGEPFEDVLQVACMGLVNAIDRYDPSRGLAFSSFAVPTISGEIKRYYRDRTLSVHVPRDLQELTLVVERARDDLATQLSRSPTVSEIADRLQIDADDVLEALQARYAKQSDSLDGSKHLGDEPGATVGDEIAVHEAGFSEAEHRADLRMLARVLTPRERLALRLSFEHDLTQAEIGKCLGVSQMQVSRILRSSIERLRHYADQRHRRLTGIAA